MTSAKKESVFNDDESNKESLDDDKLTQELSTLQVEVISSLKASIKATQLTFKVNFYINIVIVAFGIALMGTAVVQSVAKGIDPFSVTFGGLGVASFVAVFLLNPQSRLQENLCKLSQTNLILSNFLYEYDRFLGSIEETSSVKELEVINKEAERIVSFALRSLGEYVTPRGKGTNGDKSVKS